VRLVAENVAETSASIVAIFWAGLNALCFDNWSIAFNYSTSHVQRSNGGVNDVKTRLFYLRTYAVLSDSQNRNKWREQAAS